MARLTHAQQREMVIMLARFSKPAEVQKFFRAEYGILVSIQQIVAYDIRNPQFRAASKWRSLFEATEKAYIEQVATIPIAHRGFRLNLLQEAALEARYRKNYVVMAQLLEQAAKEVGGALTNRRTIDVSDDRAPAQLSEEEKLLKLAAFFDTAMGSDPEGGGSLQ